MTCPNCGHGIANERCPQCGWYAGRTNGRSCAVTFLVLIVLAAVPTAILGACFLAPPGSWYSGSQDTRQTGTIILLGTALVVAAAIANLVRVWRR